MKRSLISMALLAASSAVFAAGVNVPTVTGDTTYYPCNGTATGGKSSVWGGSGAVVNAADATFTRSGFELQCSANVHLGIREVSGNLALVAAGSAKGNQYFRGHSNGGAIGAGGKCTGTNNACGTGDVDTGITEANTAASSTGT